jgi:hypothetical protein
MGNEEISITSSVDSAAYKLLDSCTQAVYRRIGCKEKNTQNRLDGRAHSTPE